MAACIATFRNLVVCSLTFQAALAEDAVKLPGLTNVEVTSTLDGKKQAVLYWAPENARTRQTPLFVFLHSWSGDYRQKNDKWQREAVQRGWVFLHPDFRGPNNSPRACGSRFARQDILDAIAFAESEFQIDPERVYLAGTSGGGHMAMLMAGHYPHRFSAVSAWVGISDLAEWYRFHTRDGTPGRYARMILKSLGGRPGEDQQRDADYRDRSPVFHLQNTGDLPIDLYAGVNDVHTGSVPILQTLRAYNVIAEAHGTRLVSDREIEELSAPGKLSSPLASDQARDPTLKRAIFLRRRSQSARVTIFDGGHEGLPGPTGSWLEQQRRRTAAARR